jgi:glucosamine-phosphate N-acetyltransferase
MELYSQPYPTAPENGTPTATAEGPSGLTVRELTPADLGRGFLQALANLSEVGLTPEEALPVFHERQRSGVRTYVACAGGEVLGTASLLVEKKFIHKGGLVGHIEDVAVRRDLQRGGVGTALVRHATAEACRQGCYKVILNCLDDRVSFYARLGFREHDRGMRHDCR